MTGTAKKSIANVGTGFAHDSATLHVSGKARYIDDLVEPENCLHIAPGLSPVAKGKLKKLGLDKVRRADGVVAVLTAKDIPGKNECSPSIGGDAILAEKEVIFYGQALFAVVAKTRDQARLACRLAEIEIAEQKPLVSVEDGLTAKREVLPDYAFIRGKAKQAIKKAAHRSKGKMWIGGQEHFYLEGQASLAIPGENGTMMLHCSTQHPSEVQHLVANMLGRSEAAIVCQCRRMGGAFGGKESQAAQWACLAALAAYVTGKACKIRLDRDDDMIATGKRHDFAVSWQIGADKNGRLEGVDVDFAARCGCSADLSQGVVDRTLFHADNCYYFPAARLHSRRVMTNTVSNTAFRGFGGPQGMLFAERMMDQLAIEIGIDDPLEIRKANFYKGKQRSVTPYGMKVNDNILPELVGRLEKKSSYQKRRAQIAKFNAENRFLKRGIALTPVKFGIAFTLKHLNQAGALVHVYADGSIQINHGGTEMGQGLYVKTAQIVADVFGVELGRVQITATTTEKVPNTTPTAASSGSDLNGMAVKLAAEKIKARMADLAAKLLNADKAELVFAGGKVSTKGNKAASGKVAWLGFNQLAQRCFVERVQLSATGFFATPKITWDREKKRGNPFLYFAYGAACSEIVLDTLTGEMKVLRVDILHDVGNSLNPAIDIGQIEGGFVQGMGWLTSEELVYDTKGRLMTHAPSTYKIPTCSDVPETFNVELFQTPNRAPTIHHSKAVGEPPLMLAISVYLAVFQAIASLRPGFVPELDAPATPEAILKAVRKMKETPGRD